MEVGSRAKKHGKYLPKPVTAHEDQGDILIVKFSGIVRFDFSAEDKLDTESFNLILWNGIKGEGQPYPIERDGRDLSKGRDVFLRESKKNKN